MATRRSFCSRRPQQQRSTASSLSNLRSKRSLFALSKAKPMHNMLLIARREYLEAVRGRAFRMTTIGLPAIFAAVLGVGYLSRLGVGANRHMAVVAADLTLANQIRDQLAGDKDAKASVEVITQPTEEERAAL